MLTQWENEKMNGMRDLGLLKDIYTPFFNFLVQHHGNYLKKSYSVIYDARNEIEDAALHQHVEDWARKFDRVTPGGFAHYQGYKTMTSQNSAGLRLVDWLVGEIRNFFYKNPPLVEENSELDVLSPYLNPRMLLIDGRAPFYKRELSEDAKACFLNTGKGFMLPRIKKYFGSGLLTYYAKHGEARHIFIPKLVALDMAD
ncbi:MAG TPA: hypothetical protein VG347_02880 [Verrucomicrobiae bacterium]|nr:hypothetical protein [Verrucomicrobiae bacterium]